MKYLVFIIILLFSVSASAKYEFNISNCVLSDSCIEQTRKLKRYLIQISGMGEVLEDPESFIDEVIIHYYFLKRINSKPLVVGIIDFGGDHSLFILSYKKENEFAFQVSQVINFGRLRTIEILDVNKDGSDDFTCINYPKGTGMESQKVIYLNQNDQLIKP